MKQLTEITFGQKREVSSCEDIFVFSGTHPGHWEKAIEAYKNGFASKLIVTGGVSTTGVKHEKWTDGNHAEADVIMKHLCEAGIPKENIVMERKSTNTLENVLFAKEVFDFSKIKKIMFICKSHVTGRQERTLMQHLPEGIHYVPYTFDATYQGVTVSRDNWKTSQTGRQRVWGEYLRILHYGEKGDIKKIDSK